MFFFPIIERIAEWIKGQGSYGYWLWIICVGLLGAISLFIWEEDGFNEAKPLFLLTFCVWFFGGIFVALMERKP